ncbi:hypothetical protein TNCV_5062201 [Trichonephila clavipes]|nr:hypothetical protein TNCV_5062201 [Trichonephila clavipes]
MVTKRSFISTGNTGNDFFPAYWTNNTELNPMIFSSPVKESDEMLHALLSTFSNELVRDATEINIIEEHLSNINVTETRAELNRMEGRVFALPFCTQQDG